MKSDLYRRITEMATSGQYEDAEALLVSVAETLPTSERLECQGNLFFYRQRHQDAISCFESAMLNHSDYDCARYHYLLGTQAEQKGNLVEAFKRIQAAIEIEPHFVDSYTHLGGLLFHIGELEGSLQCYIDAIRFAPTDLANYHNLVAVLDRLVVLDSIQYAKQHAAAVAELTSAEKRLPIPSPNRVW